MFLVRKGNPKGIKDWDDLAKPGVAVITPNPKTSGGARWNYLAAWGYEPTTQARAATRPTARKFVEAIFRNVPVLDSGARGSTMTFAQRAVGDVLISWENEAYLILQEFGADKFEIVAPSALDPGRAAGGARRLRSSTSAAPARWRRRTSTILYTPAAQKIIAKQLLPPVASRGRRPAELAQLPQDRAVTIDAGLRRLGQGAGRAFRRRRRCSTRSTGRRQGGRAMSRMPPFAAGSRRSASRASARLRPHLRATRSPGSSLIVLLPLAALVSRASELGLDGHLRGRDRRRA